LPRLPWGADRFAGAGWRGCDEGEGALVYLFVNGNLVLRSGRFPMVHPSIAPTRQGQRGAQAALGAVGEGDVAAVGTGEVASDGEAQAGAAGGSVA